MPILRQHLLAHFALLARANVDETHDAAVRQESSDREFPKVLIERDEYTLFTVCLCQDVFITGILRQITSPQHIVAGGLNFSLPPPQMQVSSNSFMRLPRS